MLFLAKHAKWNFNLIFDFSRLSTCCRRACIRHLIYRIWWQTANRGLLGFYSVDLAVLLVAVLNWLGDTKGLFQKKEMLQTWYQSLDSASRGCGKRCPLGTCQLFDKRRFQYHGAPVFHLVKPARFLKKCNRVSARLGLKELLAKPSIFFASPSLYRIDKSYPFSYSIFSSRLVL